MTLKPLLLIALLMGPPVPTVQKVSDMSQLHHHSKWHWMAIGAVVATGTVLAYKLSEPHLRERRIGGVCCGPGCLLSECHIPPGGY